MSRNFNIPNSWVSCTLGDVIDYGRTIKAEPNEIPPNAWLLELEDIEKDTSRLLHKILFSQRQSKSAKNKFDLGDVLYGKLRPYLNKVIIADQDGYCSTEILPLKPNQTIDSRFLFYWLKHPQFIDYAKTKSHGLTMPRLSTKAGKEAPLILAPLNEQKRIADKLDNLFLRVNICRDRLNNASRVINKIRQSIFDLATSSELTRDWIYTNNPETWREVTLEELLIEKPRNGYSPRAVDYETETRSLTLTATTSGEFDARHIKYIDEKIPEDSYLWLEPGDILIQRANSLDYVGVSAIYDGPLKSFIYPDLMMKCKANDQVLTEFLFYLLSSSSVRNYFRQNATGTAGNMPKINQKIVIAASVFVPSIKEQEEIIGRVENLLLQVENLEIYYKRACAELDKIIASLLTKAFNGELVEQDSNDEPAETLLRKINVEHITNSKKISKPRKPAMDKITEEFVREVICKFPEDFFTFDEIFEKIPGDYDSLKNILFDLLSESEPSLTQVFDREQEIMYFFREKQ